MATNDNKRDLVGVVIIQIENIQTAIIRLESLKYRLNYLTAKSADIHKAHFKMIRTEGRGTYFIDTRTNTVVISSQEWQIVREEADARALGQ